MRYSWTRIHATKPKPEQAARDQTSHAKSAPSSSPCGEDGTKSGKAVAAAYSASSLASSASPRQSGLASCGATSRCGNGPCGAKVYFSPSESDLRWQTVDRGPPQVAWTRCALANGLARAGCRPFVGYLLRVTLTFMGSHLPLRVATLASEYIPHLEQKTNLLPLEKAPMDNLREACTSESSLFLPPQGFCSKLACGPLAHLPHLLQTHLRQLCEHLS
jgi:hypothetical protein